METVRCFIFQLPVGGGGGEEKNKRRRQKPGDNFLEAHLTWSLWRLETWKMKISSLVYALLTRALFGGRNVFSFLFFL